MPPFGIIVAAVKLGIALVVGQAQVRRVAGPNLAAMALVMDVWLALG